MIGENYYRHFAELTHRNGLQFDGEVIYSNRGAYPPADVLKLNAYADVPMTEFWAEGNDKQLLEYKPLSRPKQGFPTYAALAYNKQIIASEAYTGYAHYSETPFDLKPFGDAAYCSGINQLVFHSFVHEPLDLKPGMTLGKFGGHYNRNNPVFEFNQDWMKYQQRVQYLLQQGEPVVDIAFFVGDEYPQLFSKSYVSQLPQGYRENACDIQMLMQSKVKNEKLSFGWQQDFPVLLLPNSGKMHFATLKRLATLVKDGAVIYGAKPAGSPGLKETTNDAPAFKMLADSVWGNGGIHAYGKGKMISALSLSDVLPALGLLPDFATNTGDANELMYIHRRSGDQDLYFVFNQLNRSLNRELSFKITGKTPRLLNAVNGTITSPAIYSFDHAVTKIPVSFQPYESKIFVFENGQPVHYINKFYEGGRQVFPQINISDTGYTIPGAWYKDGSFLFTSSYDADYSFETNQHQTIKASLMAPKILAMQNTSINISFQPVSGDTIEAVNVQALKSLTDFENPAIKYFSGKAKYIIQFGISDTACTTGDSIVLDLGDLSATSEVLLNGKFLAYAWQPNTRIPVSGILQPANTLEVTVANVCRNRFIGDLIQYGTIQSLWTTSPIETILSKDMPLKPSGLIGPVKIMAYSKQELKSN